MLEHICMYVSRSLQSVDAISEKKNHININYFITFVSILAISSIEPQKNDAKKRANICLTIVAAYGLEHDYTVDKLCAFICATRQMGSTQ